MSINARNLTEGIVVKTLDAAGAITEANGFQYIDGSLLPSVIQKMAITAVLAKSWVVPGIACTEEFQEGIDPNKVWSIWVEVQADIGPTTRTVGPNGTANNNGIVNFAPSIVTTTIPLEIKLNQVDDQTLFFPRMQVETMRYDKIRTTLTNYLDNAVLSKATYETAIAIAGAHYRASAAYAATTGGNSNLPTAQFITIDNSKIYDDNYMIQTMNKMDEAMSAGDPDTGAMTFGGQRTVLARLSFINAFKTPKSGFVANASNEAFKLLMDPSFDINNLSAFGGTTEQYRGHIRGYDFYEIPNAAFAYIAKWLGLTENDLKGIQAVLTSPLQLATGGYADVNPFIDTHVSPYPGTYISPYRKFGARAYRNIILVVDNTYVPNAKLIGTVTVDETPGTPLTEPCPCVAPADWGLKVTTVVKNELSNGPDLKFVGKVNGASDPVTNGTTNPTKS